MTKSSPLSSGSPPSIARIFRIIDHPLRKNVVDILHELGSISFKSLTERLSVEKAALAYHLRIMKNAGLIENYYDRIEGSRAHSFYRLTAFSKWLISHDLKLSMESQLFRPPLAEQILEDVETILEYGEETGIIIRYQDDRAEAQSDNRPSRALSKISAESLTRYEKNVKLRSDPRIRNYNYRIKVKQ